MDRVNNLKIACLTKLAVAEVILEEDYGNLPPSSKLRLHTKINILKHLIDFETYAHFLNEEELNKYIENNIDIILGFYEE